MRALPQRTVRRGALFIRKCAFTYAWQTPDEQCHLYGRRFPPPRQIVFKQGLARDLPMKLGLMDAASVDSKERCEHLCSAIHTGARQVVPLPHFVLVSCQRRHMPVARNVPIPDGAV